jgi:hypothetical protein
VRLVQAPPDRALYLPTFSHIFIVKKFSLSLSSCTPMVLHSSRMSSRHVGVQLWKQAKRGSSEAGEASLSLHVPSARLSNHMASRHMGAELVTQDLASCDAYTPTSYKTPLVLVCDAYTAHCHTCVRALKLVWRSWCGIEAAVALKLVCKLVCRDSRNSSSRSRMECGRRECGYSNRMECGYSNRCLW